MIIFHIIQQTTDGDYVMVGVDDGQEYVVHKYLINNKLASAHKVLSTFVFSNQKMRN